MLGKFGGSGDLIPSALRWLRRRGGADEATSTTVPDEAVDAGSVPSIVVDAASVQAADGTGPGQPVAGLSAGPAGIGMADGQVPDALAPLEPLPTAADVPDLRLLVEENKNDPKLRWQLGLALVAARKLNLALAHLEVAAGQDPSLDQGELADVRELQRAERQVRRYPRDPELRLALGRLYLALDQGDAALAELEESARLRPDLAPTHTLLGFEYAYRGRIARAREHWGRAHDLDPADEMSKAGLDAIEDGRDPLRAIWQAAAASS